MDYEEDESFTMEEALYEADYTEVCRALKERFPNAYEEFDPEELLKCVFEKDEPYLWYIEKTDDNDYRILSIYQPEQDVFSITEYYDGYSYYKYEEVYYKRIIVIGDCLDLVYEPACLINEWLETLKVPAIA